MSENRISDIIKASLDGVKSFTDMDTVIGDAINTPSGVTVIPVSKISVGFAGGGLDIGGKKLTANQNYGTGTGSGVSVTPIAFLTIGKNAEINLISIDQKVNTSVDRVTSLIEHSPEIIRKIRDVLG